MADPEKNGISNRALAAIVIEWVRVNVTRTTKTLHLVWKTDDKTLLSVFLLTLLSAVLPLGIAYVGKLIIDSVVAHSVRLTCQRVLLELGLVTLQTVSARMLGLFRFILGTKLSIEINSLVFKKSTNLKLLQIENSEVQDKLQLTTKEAISRPMRMVLDTFLVIQNTVTLLGCIGFLVAFSPIAVLVLLVASLPATIVEMRFSNRGFHLYNWQSPERRKLAYLETILAGEIYAKEIRVLELAEMLLGRHRLLSQTIYEKDRAHAIRRDLSAILWSFLALGAFYGFYLVIAYQAALGALSLGNLTLYIVALRQGQLAFQATLASLGQMYEHNLYVSNMFEFLALPSPKPIAKPAAPRAVKFPSGIVFENVSFRYPGQKAWALQDICLTIKERESLAIVGFNGAGKTTLIKLLCRLYEPTEGRILLDGLDLRGWSEPELFGRISVVFQDFNKYHFTLGENVAIGDVKHLEDRSRILHAIEKGGARSIFEGMPGGLEAQMGRAFDGSELSGGQWQRIALARVFMKSQADILVLDEPTAAMDAQAETLMLQTFREMTRGKTSIIISHHFPVARIAERILVLEQGRVIEDGSHAFLFQNEGRYSHLFSLQAQGYA